MIHTDLNRIRRFELKYIIDEGTAAAIRDWISPLFRLDEHVAAGHSGYLVNNLYFDTPERRFYLETKQKVPNRFKLRVRYYSYQPRDLLMLEVKNKHNGIVFKNRQQLPIEQWPQALDDWRQMPANGHGIDSATFFAQKNVCRADPVLHVRYYREPYVSEVDPYGRITFDRQLRYCMADASYRLGQSDGEMRYYDDWETSGSQHDPVVLEIKTEVFMPAWARTLIRTFNLQQRGYSKYCYALDCEQWLPMPRHSRWNR